MTREELLRDAGYQITEAISVADLDQDKFRRMTGHHALVAIACVLLARELREGKVSQQVEAEAEQMVAAQMEEKPSGGHVLSDSELIRLRQWFEDYNHFLGDNISEGVMERIRRLTDSHRAANARIRELEEEHGVACCVRCGYPGQV